MILTIMKMLVDGNFFVKYKGPAFVFVQLQQECKFKVYVYNVILLCAVAYKKKKITRKK